MALQLWATTLHQATCTSTCRGPPTLLLLKGQCNAVALISTACKVAAVLLHQSAPPARSVQHCCIDQHRLQGWCILSASCIRTNMSVIACFLGPDRWACTSCLSLTEFECMDSSPSLPFPHPQLLTTSPCLLACAPDSHAPASWCACV
eukprot:scaffold159966_cov23-Tisochrysis_lutea.AAC.1